VDFCQRIAAIFPDGSCPPLITLCKGLIPKSLRLPTDAVGEILPGCPVAVLSGPTNALEVAMHMPTAAVLASANMGNWQLRTMQGAIHSDRFRLYRSRDVRGVELGGCLKNPYAIGMGIAEAIGIGDNGRAALFTRMLDEMIRIGIALGGRRETFFGLSGMGDFLATAVGRWSRNRSFGERIGRGELPEQILNEGRLTVEGYNAVAGFHGLCRDLGIKSPILDEIYSIVYLGKSPPISFRTLMERNFCEESSDSTLVH
jgi:glycerol-3-phosphate dehydrogenase (NAD(P)+)